VVVVVRGGTLWGGWSRHHTASQKAAGPIYNDVIDFFLIYLTFPARPTASVVQWPEFLAVNPEVPGSIPSATKFSA
jgi:hypothetical protein